MYRISLPLYFALRFFQNNQKHKIISFISNISIIANSLGIAMLIISLSAINGFNKELNERILSIIPHGEIEFINSKFYNWSTILNQIKKISGVIQATPYINLSCLIEKKNEFYPIQIRGINTLYDIHPEIITYLSSINTSKIFSPNQQFIILGQGAANTLKIQKNEWINILIHDPNSKNNFTPYKKIYIKVIDILNLKSYLDHNLALIPLLDAQKYLNQMDDISGINIKVNNIFNISKILKQAKKIINNTVIMHSWIDIYNYIYQDIQIIRVIIFLTMTLVIIIASFNIISILTLTIKEKRNDITILRILGTENYLICTSLIWYSFLNNLISIIIGGIFGILISLHLTDIYNILAKIFKFNILNNNSYFINFLPSELHIKDIILVIILELILTFLATLYPIIRKNYITHTKLLK